jgi:hypothetical protein
MRIGIREQLAAVVLLAVLISLGIVSIPTWLFVNNFVGDVKIQALALTASLKAAQIASVLDQLRVISNSITTRGLIQDSLRQYYTGNVNRTDWAAAVSTRTCTPHLWLIFRFTSMMYVLLLVPSTHTFTGDDSSECAAVQLLR